LRFFLWRRGHGWNFASVWPLAVARGFFRYLVFTLRHRRDSGVGRTLRTSVASGDDFL